MWSGVMAVILGIHVISIWRLASDKKKLALKKNYRWGGGDIQLRNFFLELALGIHKVSAHYYFQLTLYDAGGGYLKITYV